MEELVMHPAPLAVMDYVGPALGALLFVALMSLVAEPTRRTLNAVILAGASGVYLSGGFGLWELTYPVIGAAIGFRALRSYRWIGLGWLIHAVWDIAHHLWGNPIWPFMPSSAFGCMIFDGMIAPWFLAGTPSFLKRPTPRCASPARERRTKAMFRRIRGWTVPAPLHQAAGTVAPSMTYSVPVIAAALGETPAR